MRAFVYKIIKFILILLGILITHLLISTKIVESKNFNNSNTLSNTLFKTQNKDFDLYFMGISHARNFSRNNNHEIVENILNKKILNAGIGQSMCGLNEQFFYLKYFLNNNVKIDQVILLLSPPLLFNDQLAKASNTFKYETFNFKFLFEYLLFKSEHKGSRIISYIQYKLNPWWLFFSPIKGTYRLDKLSKLPTKIEIENGFKKAYGYELNMERYFKSIKTIKKIIAFCEKNEIKIKFIIPPALFGKWPQHDKIIKDLTNNFPNIKILDSSESIQNPNYYYDNHHLNSNGVNFYTKNYLSDFVSFP